MNQDSVNQSRNPQAEQMGDESMVRNLAYQADAIWPQELPLFDRYGLDRIESGGALRILDLGCGTGEITRRLATRYPSATLIGIDILESNLLLARRDSAAFTDRIRYEQGDAFALDHADASFDLVVCRHMSQAVPNFPLVLAEITRVLKPGGWLHLLSEDYGMLHMPVVDRGGSRFDPDRFWNYNACVFLQSIGCDERIGRHSPALLETSGYREIAMDFITVDTLRVPRATFAGILKAWRDGYAEPLAGATGRSLEEVTADFDTMIMCVETPPYYVVWHVPVISGRKPD